MDELGYLLYPAFALLVFYMWWQVRGLTLDQMFARAEAEHRKVHRMLKKHPQGGYRTELRRWMEEDS